MGGKYSRRPSDFAGLSERRLRLESELGVHSLNTLITAVGHMMGLEEQVDFGRQVSISPTQTDKANTLIALPRTSVEKLQSPAGYRHSHCDGNLEIVCEVRGSCKLSTSCRADLGKAPAGSQAE